MIWKVHGKGESVIEVWEDFYGDLWFVTEIEENGNRFGYARLYSMPDCAEWGCFNINHLRQQIGKNKIWKVSKKNWENINTYEEGLLVEVGD